MLFRSHTAEKKGDYKFGFDEIFIPNGFDITYALFNDELVSDIIDLHPKDELIKVGMDFSEHTVKREDGSYPYPNQDYILKLIGDTSHLKVAGFHM